jgi:hypothetical protein
VKPLDKITEKLEIEDIEKLVKSFKLVLEKYLFFASAVWG